MVNIILEFHFIVPLIESFLFYHTTLNFYLSFRYRLSSKLRLLPEGEGTSLSNGNNVPKDRIFLSEAMSKEEGELEIAIPCKSGIQSIGKILPPRSNAQKHDVSKNC